MDGQAAKFAWGTKGDSGSRFCQQCANIFQFADDNELDVECGHMSEVSKYTKFNQLHLVSSQEIFSSWDRMSARHGNVSKKDFQAWEQAAGVSYSPHSLLATKELRPILDPSTQNCWDWMHCLLSNGVISIGMFKWLELLDQWDILHGYVQQFLLPKAYNNIKLAPLFEPKRLAKHRAHVKMNATASELLPLCTIREHFARTVCIPAHAHKAETELILDLICFVNLLQGTWHGKVQPMQLQAAAEEGLGKWNALDWKMIKKHHWMLHFHQMLKHHHCIPSCFCMERKNKVPTRIATGIQNLRTFEHSLYLEVITLEMEKVKAPDVFFNWHSLGGGPGLVGKRFWHWLPKCGAI